MSIFNEESFIFFRYMQCIFQIAVPFSKDKVFSNFLRPLLYTYTPPQMHLFPPVSPRLILSACGTLFNCRPANCIRFLYLVSWLFLLLLLSTVKSARNKSKWLASTKPNFLLFYIIILYRKINLTRNGTISYNIFITVLDRF